jgi:hypothetical protein
VKSSIFWEYKPVEPLEKLLTACFMLISRLAYSTLIMEVACSSEPLVDFQRTTRDGIPEDSTLHKHRCNGVDYVYTLHKEETTDSSYNM